MSLDRKEGVETNEEVDWREAEGGLDGVVEGEGDWEGEMEVEEVCEDDTVNDISEEGVAALWVAILLAVALKEDTNEKEANAVVLADTEED